MCKRLLREESSACCDVLDAANVTHVTRRAAEVGQLNVHVEHRRGAGDTLIGALCDTHYSG